MGEGWELEPFIWILAQQEIVRAGVRGRVKVHFGNMWKADLAQYDLVYVYQLTRYAKKFVKKCQKEMKPKSLVVANTYPLKGLKELRRDGEIFVYQI